VYNRGHGGCHEYSPINYEPDTRARFDEVDAWAKSLPPQKFGDMELPSDLDSVIDDLLHEYELRQTLKRITKGKIAFVEKGLLYTTKLLNPDPAYIGFAILRFKTKKPDAIVLNTMPESEAIALLKVAA
jgi:hypothetical protein